MLYSLLMLVIFPDKREPIIKSTLAATPAPFPTATYATYSSSTANTALNKLKLKYSSQAFPIRGLQAPYNHYGA